jgi:predicted PurR-regulated permease PerM
MFSIISPFFGPLIIAAIFAFLFHPLYEKINAVVKNRRSIAAAITTLIAFIIIMIPISFLVTQIVIESTQIYKYIVDGGSDTLVNGLNNSVNQLRNVLPIPENFNLDFKQYAKQVLEVLIQNFGSIFSSFTKIILNSFVFILAFYFFCKDGIKLKDYFVEVSPLQDKDDDKIVSRLKRAVTATVKGSLMIGTLQGIMTGIGLAIFGVPNAVFWGSLAAIGALVPGVGTTIVLLPSIIFLFATGNSFGGIGLIIWGVVAVGLIDNILSPKIVGKGMSLHPLLVFLSVLGGLAFYGPLGFLLGPLTASVTLALIEIYFSLKSQK